jgi:acyl carrier protein
MTANKIEPVWTLEEIETTLESIWQEALPVPPEEIQDGVPFLELGGDSLSAMICITRIREKFSLELDIVDFFLDDSTISHFARAIVIRLSNEIS